MTNDVACEVTINPEHKFLEGKFMCLASVCESALCFFPVLNPDVAPVELYSLKVNVQFEWNGKTREGKTEGVFSLTKSNHYVRFERSEDLDPKEVHQKVAARNPEMNLQIRVEPKLKRVRAGNWLSQPIQMASRQEPFSIAFGYTPALGCIACELFWCETKEDPKYVVTPFIVEIWVNEGQDGENKRLCLHKSVSGVLTKWKPLLLKITSEDMNLGNIQSGQIELCWAVDPGYARALCPDTVCLSDRSSWFAGAMCGASVSSVMRTLMYLFLKYPSILREYWRTFFTDYYWDPGGMTEDDFEAAIAIDGALASDQGTKDKEVFSVFLMSNFEITKVPNESDVTFAVVVPDHGVMSIDEYNAYQDVLPKYEKAYVLKERKQGSRTPTRTKSTQVSVLDWKPKVLGGEDWENLWLLCHEAEQNGEWLFTYDERWTKLSAIATPIIPSGVQNLVIARGIMMEDASVLFLHYSVKQSDGFFWISSDSDITVFEGEIPDDSLSIQISAHLSLIVTSKSKEAPLSQMTKYKFSWIAYSDKLGYLEPPPERADKRPVAVLALGQSAERKLPPLPVTKDKAQTTYEVQEMVQTPTGYRYNAYIMKPAAPK